MVKQSHWSLRVGPVGCPETSVTNCQTMCRQHPWLQLHCSGSLKSCLSKMVLKYIYREGKFVPMINNSTMMLKCREEVRRHEVMISAPNWNELSDSYSTPEKNCSSWLNRLLDWLRVNLNVGPKRKIPQICKDVFSHKQLAIFAVHCLVTRFDLIIRPLYKNMGAYRT